MKKSIVFIMLLITTCIFAYDVSDIKNIVENRIKYDESFKWTKERAKGITYNEFLTDVVFVCIQEENNKISSIYIASSFKDKKTEALIIKVFDDLKSLIGLPDYALSDLKSNYKYEELENRSVMIGGDDSCIYVSISFF